MGRIFRRAWEKVTPPPTTDLWVRPTTCGHELLYFDKRFQRWHAFHYLVYADEIRQLKEFVEKIISDDIKDIINEVVDKRIGELEGKIDSLLELKNDVEKNKQDIIDTNINLKYKVKEIVDDAFANKVIDSKNIEYKDSDENIWKLNDYLDLVKSFTIDKASEMTWEDGSTEYTLRNCNSKVKIISDSPIEGLIVSQSKSNI